MKCKKCGLIYENPRDSEDELLKHFISDEIRIRHKKDVWYTAKIKIFKKNLKRIEKYLPNGGMLLDVGCGYGTFLKMARDNGWKVQGVEISQSAYSHAKEELGLNIFKGTLKEAHFPDNCFDIVTLWDVLDLLTDPLGELSQINRILKPGGLVLFRVRNVTFHLNVYRLFGNIARKLNIKPTLFQLYGFSVKTAKRMLWKVGFEDVKIISSELTTGDPYSQGRVFSQFGMRVIKKVVFSLSWLVYYLTGGRLILAPSILVFAKKSAG
ncbi:MAG: class I SAM-dependent methyltransferase [bacterium]